MKRTVFYLSLAAVLVSSFVETDTQKNYLQRVLHKLEHIESATFWAESQSWNPGDTTATSVVNQYFEEYRNPLDTTIGASWAIFETDQKNHLKSAYDGKMKVSRYDDLQKMVIDSFTVRKLPFRPIAPPFYNYTENIIRYILENNDSTSVEQIDTGADIYIKLTVYEDRQVEFFGKAHYLPQNPFTFDPISIYELWINKETDLPYKVRRELEHDISVISVSDYRFNKLNIKDFVVSDYFPKDYKITQYGQEKMEIRADIKEMIGKKASNWTLSTAHDQDLSLSDLDSKVIMLQFTSVSCGPCRASIPFLKQLTTEYKKADFDFVAIECTSKNVDVLKTYMDRNNFGYRFIRANREVLNDYSISSYPVFFILDENRNITNVINGYGQEKTDKEIRSLINDLL